MDLFDWAASETLEADQVSLVEDEADSLPANPSAAPLPWPSYDQPPPNGSISLAEALTRTATSPRRAEWRSAVTRLAKLARTEPGQLPAAPIELGLLLDRVPAGSKRISRKSWSNIKTGIRALLEEVGLHVPRSVLRAPLTGAWLAVMRRAPNTPQIACVRALGRWCDARGITPDQVDEAVLADYLDWRRRWTLDCHMPLLGSTIRQGWNHAAKHVEGWPACWLKAAPRVRGRHRLLLEELPQTFQEDLGRYLSAMAAPPDPLDPRTGRRLAVPTIRLHNDHLRGAATELARHLGGADKITSLRCLVEPEAAKVILLAEYDAVTSKWSAQALLRAHALVRMADKHLRWSDEQLEELRGFRRHIHTASGGETRRRGGTARRRKMLRQFDDPVVVRRFLELPQELFLKADKLAKDGAPIRAAQLHERALALALLQEFAFRRRNIVALEISRHLMRDARGRILSITIDGAETKNGVTLGGKVKVELARRIQQHLEKYRPLLPGARTDWLFPSVKHDGHCCPIGLRGRLTKLILSSIGVRMSLHDHRHVAAKLLGESDPNAMPIMQRLLGHDGVNTTERMYGQSSTTAAQARYSEMLDGIRKRRIRSRQSRRLEGGRGA